MLNSRRHFGLVLACLAFIPIVAGAQLGTSAAEANTRKPMKDIRYVVIHTPGPKWTPGKTMFEQPGVREHVAHYSKLLESGKLALGGPNLDEKGGGMMIPVAGVSEDEIRKFALEDPAVKSGLLIAEIRPWLIGMSQ
jgi:uncharacterized protein YciI